MLLLSSLGLLVISTGLALSVILWGSLALVSAPVFALMVLSEVVIISLATGACVGGVSVLLKAVSDALTRLGKALSLHNIGDRLENCGLNLELYVRGLTNRTKNILKLILGDRKKQFLFVLLLILLPPLLAISGRAVGAAIEPPGIAIIKRAVLLSINFFKYAAIALGFVLGASLVIRRVGNEN